MNAKEALELLARAQARRKAAMQAMASAVGDEARFATALSEFTSADADLTRAKAQAVEAAREQAIASIAKAIASVTQTPEFRQVLGDVKALRVTLDDGKPTVAFASAHRVSPVRGVRYTDGKQEYSTREIVEKFLPSKYRQTRTYQRWPTASNLLAHALAEAKRQGVVLTPVSPSA